MDGVNLWRLVSIVSRERKGKKINRRVCVTMCVCVCVTDTRQGIVRDELIRDTIIRLLSDVHKRTNAAGRKTPCEQITGISR